MLMLALAVIAAPGGWPGSFVATRSRSGEPDLMLRFFTVVGCIAPSGMCAAMREMPSLLIGMSGMSADVKLSNADLGRTCSQ
jgi:hypothetical protein